MLKKSEKGNGIENENEKWEFVQNFEESSENTSTSKCSKVGNAEVTSNTVFPTADCKNESNPIAVISAESKGEICSEGIIQEAGRSCSDEVLMEKLLEKLNRVDRLEEMLLGIKLEAIPPHLQTNTAANDRPINTEMPSPASNLLSDFTNAEKNVFTTTHSAATSSTENSDLYKIVGLPNKPYISTWESSTENLKLIELQDIEMDFELFLDKILLSKRLQCVKLNCVEFLQNGRQIMTGFQLLNRLNYLIHLSPKVLEFYNHIFQRQPMEFSIGFYEHKNEGKDGNEYNDAEDDDEDEDGRFKMNTHEGILVLDMPEPCLLNILDLFSFRPPSNYDHLQALHLGFTLLKGSTSWALQTIFKNLNELSLYDVSFKIEGSKYTSPVMPPELFCCLQKLNKLKIAVPPNKKKHAPLCSCSPIITASPATLTHLLLLGNARHYYRPDLTDIHVEYAGVWYGLSDFDIYPPPPPMNTNFLWVGQLRLLNSVLRADSAGYGVGLKGIWVYRSVQVCSVELSFYNWILGNITERSQTKLLKDLGIYPGDRNFLLLREDSKKPWRVEYPDDEKTKELKTNFLFEFPL